MFPYLTAAFDTFPYVTARYATLFATFGDVSYLDRVEAAAFNRLPAPYLNGSMWSLVYFHETNTIGGCNQFGLPFECCVANGNQGWPKLIHHLFATSVQDGGASLACLLHAPAEVSTTLANDNKVSERQSRHHAAHVNSGSKSLLLILQ